MLLLDLRRAGVLVRLRTLTTSILLVVLILPSIGSAQAGGPAGSAQAGETNGSIAGTVTDVTGAVVPGATVTVAGPGVNQTATSNDQGQYSVSGLRAGAYTITVSKAGFKDFKVEGLAVAAGQAAHLDALMVPESAVTKVTVKGANAAAIETQTAQMSGTITQKQVVSLMLNGRNFAQLITLTPGVSNQTGQDEALVGVKGSSKFSVNGGRVEYNTFDVDGSDILNAGINGSSSTLIVFPSLDAINEVKVLTSNYGAIYGKSASGTVLVTTKSGGPKFHGDAYEFVRNEIWNARNFFDETHGAPLYRRNDFGFTFGGPLFIPHVFNTNKDKTFFFFSEEVRRERTPQDFNQGVPSLQERTGNFSDVCPFAEPVLGPIVVFQRSAYPDCPSSGPDPNAAGYLNTYLGNQVGPIDPNATILLNAGIIPLPNSTVGCTSTINSCYVDVVSLPTHWHEELIRVDQTINSKLRASFRNIHDSWQTINSTPQWGYVQNSFPNVQNNFVGPGEAAVARLTDVVSPAFFNDWVLSYTTDHVSLTDTNGVGGTWQRPAGLTMGYLFNNGFGDKIPGIVIGGTNGAYGGFGFSTDPSFEPWKHSNPTFTFRDDAAAVRGTQTISFGVHVVTAQKNEFDTGGGANTGDVQGLLTFSNLVGSSLIGNAFADFLTGLGVRGYQQDSTTAKYYGRYQCAEPYIQDDWRYSPHMTLNLGMRFNFFGSWHEKSNNVYNWEPGAYDPATAAVVNPSYGYLMDPNTGNPISLNLANLAPSITDGLVQCGKDGVPASCARTHHAFNVINPAPRLGFAWDPKGDGKYSIRAGYGVFFFHGTGNEANTGSLEGSAPNVLSMTQNFVPVGYECIGGVGGPQTCGNLVNGVAYPLNVTSIPTETIWPYVQQWSLSLQRQLGSSMVGSIAYVGSKGTHLVADLQLNQLPPVPAADNPFKVGNPVTVPVCQNYSGSAFPSVGLASGQPGFINLEAACYGIPGAAKAFPDPNSLRTFAPGFGEIFGLENVANSKYNALQATLRRTAGRLNLSVAYTYGSSRDDSSDRFDATLVNSFDLRSNYAPSNFDQRQLLNMSYVYDLPSMAGFGNVLRRFYQADAQLDQPYSPSGLMHRLLDDWEFSGITTAQTGTPFSVINGGSALDGVSVLDNAGVVNGIGAGSYPDLIDFTNTKPPAAGNNSKSFGPILLNPNAFAAPAGLTFGDAGRNVLRNPSRMNFDVALLKNFKLRESTTLELRGEAFNVFNHTQFMIYDPNHGNTASNVITCYGGPNNAAGYVGGGINCLEGSGFLHPIEAHRPRTIQFAAKLIF